LLLACAGVFVVVGATPVSDWALQTLEKRYPSNPSLEDAAGVIVLGGASQAGVSKQWDTLALNEHGERFLAALHLAHEHPALQVVFTGGSGSLRAGLPAEADVARQILRSTGLAADRLAIEGESRTTWENAVLTREMLGDRANERWVLITSAWHMPRSVATFCAAGWPKIVPYPADFLSEPGRPWPDWAPARRLQYLNLVTKEWLGMAAYKWSGRATGDACTD